MQQMSKSEFLEALAGSLYAYSDLTDETVKRQLKQFERYFSRMSDDEVRSAIADFDDTETIAANIYTLLKDKERQKAENPDNIQPQPRVRDYDHTASDFTVVESHISPDSEATATYDAVNLKQNRAGAVDNSSNGGDTINMDRVKPETASRSDRGTETRPAAVDTDGNNVNGTDNNRGFEGGHLDFTMLDDTPAQTPTMFWVLFAITFPLWGTVIITVLALFLFAFTALAALIVALVALMIGVAAAGTGLSLFGIIYGITQTFSVFSAGLYEIGLGVTIGGAAMFAGIIVYNIAIRFLPFVMKKLTVFLRFTIRSARQAFLRIKKECAVQ